MENWFSTSSVTSCGFSSDSQPQLGHLPWTLSNRFAADDQGRVSRRGVGGAEVFERVNLHDATKQTNRSGPHSPFTSGAETAPCQPHRCSVDKMAGRLHRSQTRVCSIVNRCEINFKTRRGTRTIWSVFL